MSIYQDFDGPVREKLATTHADTLMSFSRPGTWWTAAERSALVAEIRDARVAAGLQAASPTQDREFDEGSAVELPTAARILAREVAVSTNEFTRERCVAAMGAGLTDTQYTETVGIASRAANLDVFARGIGVPSRALVPAEPGAPLQQRPGTAMDESAFVETVPGGRRGKTDAIDIYGSNAVEGAPFIYRALSLVPAEAKGLIALGAAQYLEIDEFMNLEFSYEPSLSRGQVELLAARVSAINECFY